MSDLIEFNKRVFSGRDLIEIMDAAYIGVGATMHVVHSIEIDRRRGWRLTNWDLSGMTVDDCRKLMPSIEMRQHWTDLCDLYRVIVRARTGQRIARRVG